MASVVAATSATSGDATLRPNSGGKSAIATNAEPNPLKLCVKMATKIMGIKNHRLATAKGTETPRSRMFMIVNPLKRISKLVLLLACVFSDTLG